MSNWKEYKIEEIADVVGGGTPSTKVPQYYGGNIPWLTPKDLTNYTNRFIARGERNITKEGLSNSSARMVPKHTILLTSRAPIGYMAIAANDVCTNQGFKSIVVNPQKADFNFVFYLLKANMEYIKSYGTGTTFAEISASVVKNLKFKLPDLPTQTAIAEILSSLDDKIELNNKINQELENLAQTLFKQWFIDFEFPNENGEPYKSSGGEMVESELGEIPKGWEVKPITDFIEVKDGTHDSPKQCENGHYLITSKHLKNSFIDFDSAYKISNEDFVNVNKRSKVDKHDILITMIGTVGNLYYVGNEPNYAIKNIGLFKSSSNKTFSIYLYEYLKSSFISEYYRVRLAGSTQQYLTLKALRETPIIYNEKVVSEFVVAIKEMRHTIINNSNENKELTNLRDTLLPKLISGELEVAEVMEEKA